MAHPAAETFRRAAELNIDDPRRGGSTVTLSGDAPRIVVAGDIHGHREGLTKAICHAGTNSVLVLQEIVHGPSDQFTGHDRSVELLLRAARLKTARPERVLFLMGNHDLSQVTGNEIAKEGRGACRSFSEGVRHCFGDAAVEVMDAVNEFQTSMPLAIRCPNRVLLAHSLPSPHRMKLAGTDILDRPYSAGDLVRGGAVYEWTWGRDQTDEQTDRLAETLDVDFFLLGHRKVTSWEAVTNRAAAIATDSPHGCLVEFAPDNVLNLETFESHVVMLAGISRG
jgi:hypothetical protein